MKDEPVFKEGDEVILSSGGPLMTVYKVWDPSDAPYSCCWFSTDKVLQKASFAATALVLYEPERTVPKIMR